MEMEAANGIEIDKQLYRNVLRELMELEKLKRSLEINLGKEHSQLLARIFCSNDVATIKNEIHKEMKTILNDYEQRLIDDILYEWMVNIFTCKSRNKLLDLLQEIYHNENDPKICDLIVKFLLNYYHYSVQRMMTKDIYFQQKIAMTLYAIRQEENYKSLNGELKQKINDIIQQNFPTNLQYLLFHSHFCLMNDKYSEYIYTTVMPHTIDPSSRHVWLWHDKWSIDYMGPINAKVTESKSNNKLLIELRSVKYKQLYYIMADTNLVASWELQSEPLNYIWSIEFVDDERVVFYQGEYIMCSNDEMYDTERRVVKAYSNAIYNFTSTECQWLLGKCDRRTDKKEMGK
ncbi:uncharacterized protein LOC133333707 [Musca vetustissima]|uniref:uncharacterized protein LOC133333707 n=1 Tax=Musca vetustissima TaxID=27455 RepID=UPI002AB75A73|nr:uncharacterized protein LOC133333707 [Musca vetustissima]